MSRPVPPVNTSAVAWALLSQSVWLPLVTINLHDRWQARVRELSPPTDSPALVAKGLDELPPPDLKTQPGNIRHGGLETRSTGVVLGAAQRSSDPLLDRLVNSSREASQSKAQQAGPQDPNTKEIIGLRSRPLAPSTVAALEESRARSFTIPPQSSPASPQTTSGAIHKPPAQIPTDPLKEIFTPSEMLGGSVTREDINSPSMPPMARAERARWSRSGDAMAPLPRPWREPIREAIRNLPESPETVAPARVIHVPSSQVSRSTPVPLAIQSDGTVDILTSPDNPAVVDEIREWSQRQAPPAKGAVVPAVVHLEPLPPEPDADVSTLSSNSPKPSLQSELLGPGPALIRKSSHQGASELPPSPVASPIVRPTRLETSAEVSQSSSSGPILRKPTLPPPPPPISTDVISPAQ